jgi:signal transduction histidine kinase
VLVEDDGGSGPRDAAGTGHGLLGLRERVEVFDGTLEAAALPAGGFRVRVLLPLGGTA